eukprot:3681109-Amphidinium_carterae.1
MQAKLVCSFLGQLYAMQHNKDVVTTTDASRLAQLVHNQFSYTCANMMSNFDCVLVLRADMKLKEGFARMLPGCKWLTKDLATKPFHCNQTVTE